MKQRVPAKRFALRRAGWVSLSSFAICLHASLAQPPILPQPAEEVVAPPSSLPMRTKPVPGEPIRAENGLIESARIEVVEEDPVSGNAANESSPVNAPETLTPVDVIASVYRAFPEINQARQQARLAQGQIVEAQGAYDLKLKAFSLSEPTGFYENYRNGIGVARQAWWGTQLAAGYRIGRGSFQPWYKERETEKGGEFKVGLIQPLLQGRAIDEQRVALFRASLARQAADPILQEAILSTARDATLAYWQWIAWGATLQAQQELLDLAESRGTQFEIGVEAGKFAEIDLIVNDQLIAERRGKVLETEQKYRESAFKLSLFLRDEAGNPMVPPEDWMPKTFPEIQSLPPDGLNQAVSMALLQRPEPRRLQLEIRQVDLDRRLARNQTLPRFDFIVEGSKDVGEPGSSSDDKGPFELIIGAQSEVPIQRRKALGKIQSTSAKIAQLQEKLRLQRDKITQEIRTAYNKLELSAKMVEQADLSLRAAVEALDRYRFAFDRGKIDLIYLNLLETKANETEIKLIDAQRNWFMALAEFQAASGLDPIDEARLVTELPASDRPGPGRLPHPDLPKPDEFDQDWQRRTGSGNQP